jgi:hypothetical protein
MGSLRKIILLFALLRVYCCIAREQLVLPEGEVHSILCTAPDEDHFGTSWRTAAGGEVGNEGTFTVGEEEPTTNGTKGRRVMFTASPEENGTTLICVVINFRQPSDSPEPLEFTIIIQGTLPAPDVDYTIMEDGSILFTWSPPFSHNITDVEPDISHYLVTIINTEDHHSVLTVNTTDTEYLLQSQDCQLSDYQVEIAAVNVVGVGDKYTSPPLTLDELDISDNVTVFLGRNSPVVNIKVRTSCHINLDLSLSPRFSGDTIHLTSDNVSKEETTLNISSSEIKFKEYYTAIVTVDGLDSFSHKLNFSTFDVQDVVIEEERSGHEITCYFAPGSQTKGCRIVIIQEGRGGDDCQFNTTATRLEGAGDAVVNVELPAGEYSVVVYDDEQVPEENPAYTTTLSIPGATPIVGCVFEKETESTSDSEENNLALVIGVVVAVAVMSVAVFVGSLFFAMIYIRGRKKTVPVQKDPVRGQESTTETPAVSQHSAEKPFEQSSPSEDRELKPSAESSSVSDYQTRTTTPPDTHKGKYIQVQLKTETNVQNLPNTNEEVLYSTIVPHNTAP